MYVPRMLVICLVSWCGEEGSSISGKLFYQIESFLTNSSNQHFFSPLVILSRAGFWIIFEFQVWFPLLFGFEFKS